MNVQELIDVLTEAVENDDKIASRLVLAVHQQSYPLQENIVGIFDPGNSGYEEARAARGQLCAGCESEVGGQVVHFDLTDDDSIALCGECFANEQEQAGDQPFYLVVNGHPYDLSPYGPRAAFSDRL